MRTSLQPYVSQVPSAEVTSQAARKLHSAASVLKSHAAELEKRRAEERGPRDAGEEEEEEEGEDPRRGDPRHGGMEPGLVEFAALVARDLSRREAYGTALLPLLCEL